MFAAQLFRDFFCGNLENPYFMHSVRTGDYLVSMFCTIQQSKLRDSFSLYSKDTVALAGLLHDIGKMSIPEGILLKNGPLTNDEWKIMKNHPAYGAEILKSEEVRRQIEYVWPTVQVKHAIETARFHHERVDGFGYPDGVKNIPPLARLCAVADTLDAMTNDRPYRRGASLFDALNTISESAGTQFDESIVNVLLNDLSWLYPTEMCKETIKKGRERFGNH